MKVSGGVKEDIYIRKYLNVYLVIQRNTDCLVSMDPQSFKNYMVSTQACKDIWLKHTMTTNGVL